ncbi:MAG: hypothetical protein ABS68_11010 [Niastella sp. SCN 39-18]|nr:Rrf2 family transcriptional regulator [Sphingobacteriales bacterium]ODT51908.1 MAG: hypothetical protein ABS68_11010 [Niastella sp. SCN 39-18]OJW11546.1 MAG: hypothetical protein BGO53_11470 [Sphingobacteriales bacterium 39-19]
MFSKSTEYALRATIYIAQKSSEDHKVGLAEISAAIDSPPSFTAKILQALRKDNKIIRSVPGPNGGFYITEKAKNLPVHAILKVMGEDDVLNRCVLGLDKCSEVKPCPMHAEYKIIKAQLLELFDRKTILDLENDIKTGEVFIKNSKKK